MMKRSALTASRGKQLLHESEKRKIRGLLPPATSETLTRSALAKFDFIQRMKTADAKGIFPIFHDTVEEMLVDYAGEMKHLQFRAQDPAKAEEAFNAAFENLGVINLLLKKSGKDPITKDELKVLFFKRKSKS